MDISILKSWLICLCIALLGAGFVAHADAERTRHDLRVEDAVGKVKVRNSDRWRSPVVGMAMGMPSIASTGNDGRIKISQQDTLISVASNTTVEILEGPVPGQAMQRVVQDRGSAFYDIAPRGSNKLRVEAAYLVAVVKGTQFNVTVDTDSTTIALFEGRLQVEAPFVGDVVDIVAGQIAKFHSNDRQISIISMASGETIVRSDKNGGSSDGGVISASLGTGSGASLTVAPGATTTVKGGATVGLQESELSVASSTELGDATVAGELAANLDLGSGQVGLESGASFELGETGLDAGADAGIDLGGELELDVDAGPLGVDADLDLDPAGEMGESLGEGIDDLLDVTEPIDTGSEEIVELLPDPADLLGI